MTSFERRVGPRWFEDAERPCFSELAWCYRSLLWETGVAVTVAPHEHGAPDLAVLLRCVRDPAFTPMSLGWSHERTPERVTLTVRDDALRPTERLREDVASVLDQAFRHGGVQPEPATTRLAEQFCHEFVQPRAWTNFRGSSWTPLTRHTRDLVVCVMDATRVGILLTVDDE